MAPILLIFARRESIDHSIGYAMHFSNSALSCVFEISNFSKLTTYFSYNSVNLLRYELW